MLKYTLMGLAGGFALIAAGFFVLARWNDRDAEAGPTPLVVVTVDADGASPARIEIDEDRLTELRIVNAGIFVRAARTDADGVEQLPVETNRPGPHSASKPVPGFQLLVGAQDDGSALVRFDHSGDFELRIESPGRPQTLSIVTIAVR